MTDQANRPIRKIGAHLQDAIHHLEGVPISEEEKATFTRLLNAAARIVNRKKSAEPERSPSIQKRLYP